MQVVAIETTIGLFLLERKHTINLSFNLLYCCKVHTNAAAQVQIHYTLLCHCAPKSPPQIHFWKCLLERKFWLHAFSCCLICPGWEQRWSGKEGPSFSCHPSNAPLPCPAPLPAEPLGSEHPWGKTLQLCLKTEARQNWGNKKLLYLLKLFYLLKGFRCI